MTEPHHYHFMGIGGIGMSALARWLHDDGYTVSGCDLSPSPELQRLQQQGIQVSVGHDPAHVRDIDTLVYSMAVPEGHPEILEARQQGKITMARIALLADFFRQRRSIGITGTHGKSTTTGMLAHIAMHSQHDPSVLIGAKLPCIDGNTHYGKGDSLIAEVDESDPGFVQLHSQLAIVTNLEDDHIAGSYQERRNYHASLADLEQASQRFVQQAQQLLYCADWPKLESLFADHPARHSYGLSPHADYRAEALELGAHSSQFTFCTPAGQRWPVQLAVPGSHNVQNALAALAAAELWGMNLEQACQALAAFHGVGRRWQRYGSVAGALIIDDYAHHPTEVAATLRTAKHSGRRVRAVLQPHRWIRTARHWPALAEAAALADEILLLDIYAAGEAAIPGISAQLIVEKLQSIGKRARLYSMAEAEHYLATSLESNDLVITMGAGDVWKVAEGLLRAKGGDDSSA